MKSAGGARGLPKGSKRNAGGKGNSIGIGSFKISKNDDERRGAVRDGGEAEEAEKNPEKIEHKSTVMEKSKQKKKKKKKKKKKQADSQLGDESKEKNQRVTFPQLTKPMISFEEVRDCFLRNFFFFFHCFVSFKKKIYIHDAFFFNT